MLDPWALRNGAARKRLARLLYEDAHLGKAACLHALCQAEADAIRLAGIATPVAVVPNGVALPDRLAPRAPWRQDMREGAKVALFLGRVTPKKRVVELITGFAAATLGDDWHLVVVGPVDDAYRGAVEAAAAAPACRGRVHVVGAAYGEARLSAYAASDLFVLPSLSEGLPMAALEAFAHGIPALLTPQCNLPEAFACGAALPIDTTEDGIADGLRRFAAMVPEERLAMGLQAEHLATHTFDWDEIARQMAGLYLNLKRGQQRSAGLLRALSGRAGLPA
jgi:poly(glycerol-phosphate) alpha-glucosyltransferase